MADVRHRFPGLGDGWARFDGPAGTQVLDQAIDAMAAYLSDGRNANAHGAFGASVATDGLVERARTSVGRFLGADPTGIVFGPNSTSLLLALTRAVARDLGPDDEIVCTELDHDANVWPWVMAAEDTGASTYFLRLDPETGRLDVETLADLVNESTAWVAITGASNAIGTIPDIRRAAEIAHAVGARIVVDAVHLAPHRPVDVASLGCDVLVTSPYKWYGPHAGVLWADPDLLASLRPYKLRPAPDRGPGRLETGTPSFEAIAGVAAAADWLWEERMDAVAEAEATVFAPLLQALLSLDHVTVHGPHDLAERTPTIAFSVAGLTPAATAVALAREQISVWAGDYYAVECMRALRLTGEGGAVRAGVARYTTPEDVDRLVEAVAALA